MPLYMTQFSYTRDAWAALLRQPEDRSQGLSQLCEQFGGRLVNLYYSFGDYDGVAIIEAPDDASAATAILAAASPGHLTSTKTTPLLTVDEAMAVMRNAGSATYRGPAGTGD